MSTCFVLRCQNPIETVVMDSEGAANQSEYGVCREHGDAIRAGAEWRVDTDDRSVILMGSDLQAGELVYSGVVFDSEVVRGSGSEMRHFLTIKAKRGANGAEESLRFEVNRRQLLGLAKFLSESAREA